MKNNNFPEPTQITGILANIIFKKNYFLIGRLNNNTIIKGDIINPQIGLKYILSGKWERHNRFGNQFSFWEYEISLPTGNEAIKAYLIENAKWIGPTISNKIVDKFGQDTLKICKNDPELIAKEINGININRAKQISAMLRSNEELEQLTIELKQIFSNIKVSKWVVARIITEFGLDAPKKIKENPYVLIEYIKGIGFITADRIAMKIGYAPDGHYRIRSAIIHILKELAQSNGHLYYPDKYLINKVRNLLSHESITKNKIKADLDCLLEREILVLTPATSNGNANNSDILNNIYLKNLFDDELLIAKKLRKLLKQEKPIFNEFDTTGLKDDQIRALKTALNNNVFILTGAAGTGKSTTLKKIIDHYDQQKLNCALAAPTGKAAKRIFECTDRAAVTIHRLLEPHKDESGQFVFSRNASNPITADVVIIDECSMIDNWLMGRLLDAISIKTRLIFSGDTYQLPSVGPGNILHDMIESKIIPTVELTEIKRQEPGLIIENCHAIKNGKNIKIDNKNSTDFFVIKKDGENDIRKTIFELVSNRLPQKYNIDKLEDIQIITPLRKKTKLGCELFNKFLQNKLNDSPEIKGCKFRYNDKIIQTKNEYGLNIINGDMGYVNFIDTVDEEIIVDFENPDRKITISLKDNNLDLAYVITCHKYQGSESPVIIIPINKCFTSLITQRNWLYTAISRAQKICILVGQVEEISKIISRNQQQKRFTGLKDMLMK